MNENKNLDDPDPVFCFWYHLHDDDTYRIVKVLAGETGYWPTGIKSNHPLAQFFPVNNFDTEEEAKGYCETVNEQLGLSEDQVSELIANSMRQPTWKVNRDPESDQVTIWKDGDVLMDLEGDVADDLFAKLKAALYPYGEPTE
jgi:hypothetical protein